MPKIRRAPSRIHIVGPAWMHGGTEQHANALARFFDPRRMRIDCVHVTTSQYFDQNFADETFLNIRETKPEDLADATADADCVLHWGIELDKYLAPSTRQARIAIAHGASHWGKAMLNGSSKTTDHTICVSQHVANEYKLATPHTVVRNGIDTARLTNTVSAHDARASIGATEETFIIGYLGRLATDKRIDRIIQAAALMTGETMVIICGCGPEEPALRDLAKRCTNTAVRFTYLSQYLGDFFQTLDAFVMPSEHEGFCLATAEAMWSRVPVVTTRTGLAATDINDGINGLITDGTPEDIAQQLTAIRENINAATCMAHLGHETASTFYMAKRMAADYADLIEREIEAKPDHEFTRRIPF